MRDYRHMIEERLRERKLTMAWLSRELGRNHAYVQQFIRTHKPSDLEFPDKLKVAKLLQIPLREMGVDFDGPPAPAQPQGVQEDAEPWTPPPSSILVSADHIAYFVARSDALDRHSFEIKRGDVVAVDVGAAALDSLVSGDAVIVQLYHKPEMTTATTVMRQYVLPGLLITNSSADNSIWRIDDETLPFEPVIKGRIVSVVRHRN